MESKMDMLQLPVLPVEWYRGQIEIMAITPDGGTVYPIGSPCPGSHISKFGVVETYEGRPKSTLMTTMNTYNLETLRLFSLLEKMYEVEANADRLTEAIESIYTGADVTIRVTGKDLEYYAIPIEKINEIPKDLVDAGLFLNPKTTHRYTVKPKVAQEAFEVLVEAGNQIDNGQEALRALLPFLNQYGFPRDAVSDIESNMEPGHHQSTGIALSGAKYQALLAYVCHKLWSCIERRDYRTISSMAQTSVEGDAIYLSFLQPKHVSTLCELGLMSKPSVPLLKLLHQTKINYIPQEMDSVWRRYARNWIYAVSEKQIASLFVRRVPTKAESFTIGLKPGGLQTAMWLHFAEKIYRADNPHEGMRQCKQGGKYHGCGDWYVPSGPEDRSHYCPTCRAKAGAERIARFRAK